MSTLSSLCNPAALELDSLKQKYEVKENATAKTQIIEKIRLKWKPKRQYQAATLWIQSRPRKSYKASDHHAFDTWLKSTLLTTWNRISMLGNSNRIQILNSLIADFEHHHQGSQYCLHCTRITPHVCVNMCVAKSWWEIMSIYISLLFLEIIWTASSRKWI